MENEAKSLIEKYNKGKTTDQDELLLEKYIAEGLVQVEELTGLAQMKSQFESVETPQPDQAMTNNFYEMLAKEKQKTKRPSFAKWWQTVWHVRPGFQWAYSILILAIGLSAGYFLRVESGKEADIKSLSAEVTEMKEMMMLSLLEKESTSDRLRAVNLTSELPDVSNKVTEALFKTLNTDDNVNVRLATIEALYPYAQDPQVREGLIDAIGKQDSPMVQVALAELMVALQEKRSVKELEQLLDKEETPEEIKERIEESIKILI